MKNGKKKLLLPLTAAACALLLAGCGTSVGEHANTYFSQMGNVIRTAIDSARAERKPTAVLPRLWTPMLWLLRPTSLWMKTATTRSTGWKMPSTTMCMSIPTPPAWRPWPRASRSRRTEALLIPEA